jgi:hypothetical protein
VNIEISLVRGVMRQHKLWERIRPDISMCPERDDVGRPLTAEEESTLLAECAKSRSRILLPFVVLTIETFARYGTIRRLE